MELFKVGKIWHYRFQAEGIPRQQRTTGCSVKGEAEAVAWKAYEEAKIRSRGNEPAPTLKQLVGRWLDSHPARVSEDSRGVVSLGHWKNVEMFGRLWIEDLKDVKVDRLTTELVMLARKQFQEGRAQKSANNWLQTLNLLGNWARECKLLPPMEPLPWTVEFIPIKKVKRPIVPVARMKEFLEAFDEQCQVLGARVAVRLMLGLGLRAGEALGMRREWWDWERGTYTPGDTKGGEADPIAAPQWLVAYLKATVGTQAGMGLLIPNPKTGKAYRKDSFMRRYLPRACEKLDLQRITQHRLRGSWVTNLLRSGTPPSEVQKGARHAELETTMGYYEDDLQVLRDHQEKMAKQAGLA